MSRHVTRYDTSVIQNYLPDDFAIVETGLKNEPRADIGFRIPIPANGEIGLRSSGVSSDLILALSISILVDASPLDAPDGTLVDVVAATTKVESILSLITSFS